jgi:hypothetical protein
MNSKEIAIQYLAPKIKDSKTIFFDLEIFKSVLCWARDSAREFFATQQSKMFLLHYIDDIAPVVDEYLISRANKMYKNALIKRNKLFWNLDSREKVIGWIIDRYINIFVSISTNKKYKEYTDITKIRIRFDQDIAFYSSDIEEEIEFEKLKKLPKESIRKALKKVWEDSKYDLDFDYLDFKELCCEFEFDANEVVGSHTFEEPKFSKYQVSNKHYQLELLF